MKVLVFDTETTGLPKKTKFGKYPDVNDSNKWPHVVQLSYILYDTQRKDMLLDRDFIIKVPASVEISPESTKIHGIDKIMSQKKGVSMREALSSFMLCIRDADAIVAHNIEFDTHILRAEGVRCKLNNPFASKNKPAFFDTMIMGKPVCNIRRQHIYTGEIVVKPPKLIELYQKLFNQTPKCLHNSFIDIVACLRCFVKLHTKDDIFEQCYRLRNAIKHE